MEKNNKNFLISYVVPVLIVGSLLCGYLFLTKMETLNKAYADMNSIEFISSSTQRLISLALTDQLLPKDVFFIRNTTEEVLLTTGGQTLSVLNDPSMVLLAETVYDSWIMIENLVQQEDLDIPTITIYREAHFKAMTDLSNCIKTYTESLNKFIADCQKMIMAMLSAISLIMLNNILNTHNQLKLSKELALMAQIDSATGLYNRSKCQELFQNNEDIKKDKRPAIAVIDLNDLKKTNDSLGHRVGDELIANFAMALKGASNVSVLKPFIGRYGGDEFIVYYENIDSAETVQTYMKELTILTDQANDSETRFQLSYAVGYSVYANEDHVTIKQLFDRADEIMYENKVAMKRAKNPNYDEQVAKGEDVR